MKKILISAFAIAALAACNKSEVVDMAPQKAIAFDAPFIENATKAIDPSFTAETLNEFYVYGTMTNASDEVANIFNAVPVTKGKTSNSGTTNETYGTWGYDSQYTQYWVSGNRYAFAAVTGVASEAVKTNSATKMPYAIIYDASNQKDLLYAVNNKGLYASGDVANSIAFDFKHLLSKAKFTFSNGYPEGFTVCVTSVSITNAHAEGNYDIAGGNWVISTSADPAAEEVEFGAGVAADATAETAAVEFATTESVVSNYERLLIPAEYTALGIQYSYYVRSPQGLKVKEVTDATASVAVTLEAGHSYNFKAEIADVLVPITFSVENLTGWDSTSGDTNVTL